MRPSSLLCLFLNGVLAVILAAKYSGAQTHVPEPQQGSGAGRLQWQPKGWRRFDMNGIWRSVHGTPGTSGYRVEEIKIEDDGDYITAETSGSPAAAENVFFVAIYDSDDIVGLIPTPGFKEGLPNHRDVPIHIGDANHIRVEGYPVFERVANGAALTPASLSGSAARQEQSADSDMFQTLSPNDPPEVRNASAMDAWIKGRNFDGEEKYHDALFWFERSAAKGNHHATADIGYLYQHGLGVRASMPMAARWYEAGAAAKDAVAIQRLALLLFNGYGVPKDQTRALGLINAAYTLGDSDAAFGLAQLYQYGAPGYSPQPQSARVWYQNAANELRKGDSLCGEEHVRDEIAVSMARMLRGAYTGRQSGVVFVLLGGTGVPLPAADAREYRPEEVKAIVRHGESEAECEATFSTDPRNWTFKVNRLGDGRYLIINATGSQWFRLLALRAEIATNGERMPIGLQNLHDFDSH
jgi:TPR repeat protein